MGKGSRELDMQDLPPMLRKRNGKSQRLDLWLFPRCAIELTAAANGS